jgi:hypothetical protein
MKELIWTVYKISGFGVEEFRSRPVAQAVDPVAADAVRFIYTFPTAPIFPTKNVAPEDIGTDNDEKNHDKC